MSITDQHYALIITHLFDTQAPTCFDIHVPSSGSIPYVLVSFLKPEMFMQFV
jgi:hypothetical protein